MAYFETKNPNMGKFWSVLQWKMLVYFVAVWSTMWPFGILVMLMVIWLFGIFIHFLVGCTKKNLATLVCTLFQRLDLPRTLVLECRVT
jgi:hypothetical protein